MLFIYVTKKAMKMRGHMEELLVAAAAVGGGTRAHRYEDRAGDQVVRKPSYALAEPQR